MECTAARPAHSARDPRPRGFGCFAAPRAARRRPQVAAGELSPGYLDVGSPLTQRRSGAGRTRPDRNRCPAGGCPLGVVLPGLLAGPPERPPGKIPRRRGHAVSRRGRPGDAGSHPCSQAATGRAVGGLPIMGSSGLCGWESALRSAGVNPRRRPVASRRAQAVTHAISDQVFSSGRGPFTSSRLTGTFPIRTTILSPFGAPQVTRASSRWGSTTMKSFWAHAVKASLL